MSLDHFPTRSGDCLSTITSPVLCLRFESARERLALPYASLVAIRFSTDNTILTILFVTHKVTIKGRNLTDVYSAVATGAAAVLALGRRTFHSSIKAANPDRPPAEPAAITISDIRIESIDAGP